MQNVLLFMMILNKIYKKEYNLELLNVKNEMNIYFIHKYKVNKLNPPFLPLI